ncbi:unnamed protein product [Lactuca saligna]|uniref:Uncharacterized protein n=1 Tax=Lactuca saligna TaxID=75948 RepID=A0AA35Y7H3_LACSI|nr:unnamed protein product [Lactuca saligna]
MFLGLYKLEKSKKCKIRDRINTEGITWKWKSSPSSNSEAREFDELALKVESFLLNTHPDMWVCNVSGDGVYHVNVVREQIDMESSTTHLHLTHSHLFLPSYKLILTAAPEPHLCQFGVRHRRCLLVTDCASSPKETRVASRKPAISSTIYGNLCPMLGFLMDMQDLANLVRRRVYKLIKELLAASQEVKVNDFNVDESLTDNKENTNTEEDETTDLDENRTKLAEAVLLSNEETSTKPSL